ncbi:hypothetical protein PQG02_32290 (plasmid) [Nostoc sp. UHCC 0926]|uniref:hypothetical protein n=1 Tax=Nostoc sp. UHCC 0926 TaxID=3025190 RepID=UPI0023621A47|nr:hypothetical protein [Nostoc sp. UHCC 0926]WDD36081.1 hypothetical protein PQG02_32290 [Nostoc sp. UHCC 0926]
MADTQPDTLSIDGESSQNVENFSKISILDLQKKYGIERDAFYARKRYLRMETWKEGGKGYLDAGQVAHMDALHEHIQRTGRMQGYPVPEPSGPIEEDEQPAAQSSLTVSETQQITPTYAPKQKRSQSPQQIDDINAIVESAKNKAAGTLIAENVLAQHFIQNPDLLPDELKTKIKESAQMPSVDPFAYADSLIGIAMGSISAA